MPDDQPAKRWVIKIYYPHGDKPFFRWVSHNNSSFGDDEWNLTTKTNATLFYDDDLARQVFRDVVQWCLEKNAESPKQERQAVMVTV